jgi:O-antigen ligase
MSKQEKFLHTVNDGVLFMLAFSIPFEYWSVVGFDAGASTVKVITIAYLVTSMPLFRSRFRITSVKDVLWPFVFFLVIQLISSVVELRPGHGFDDLFNVRLVQLLIMFVVVVNHLTYTAGLSTKVVGVFVLGMTVMGLLHQFGYAVDSSSLSVRSRITLFGENPNDIGMKAALALVMILSIVLERGINWFALKMAFASMFFPIVALLVGAGSRGAFLMMIAGSGLLLLLLQGRGRGYKMFAFGFAVVTVLYIVELVISNEMYATRLNRTFQEGDIGREEIWKSAWSIFLDNPVLGTGRARFLEIMELNLGQARPAHNLLLEVLATAGLLGGVFYMLHFGRIYKHAVMRYLESKVSLYVVLLVMLSAHMAKAGGAMTSVYCWFLLAVVLGASMDMGSEDLRLGDELVRATN